MQLPDLEKAYIDKEKLTEYLLSETHPIGRSKSKAFRKIGFSKDRVELFEKALLSIARSEDVVKFERSKFGIKYVVDGLLRGPTSEKMYIRTIWIIEKGGRVPRFVTAYPLVHKEKQND